MRNRVRSPPVSNDRPTAARVGDVSNVTAFSPARRSFPPTLAEVRDALDGLLVPSIAAALLVTSPVDTVPGVDIRLDGDSWSWRGVRISHAGDPLAALVELVRGAARPGDLFVDPASSPWQWLRPTRSGTRLHAVGFDTLLGGPALRCSTEVPDTAVFELGRMFQLGEIDAPCVLDVGGVSLLVSGEDQAWFVGTLDEDPPAARAVEPVGAVQVLELAGLLGRDLGVPVDVLGGMAPGADRGEFCCVVQGMAVRVPFTVTGATVYAGEHVVDAVPPSSDGLPPGWTAVAACGSEVCAVTPHGWWVFVRTA